MSRNAAAQGCLSGENRSQAPPGQSCSHQGSSFRPALQTQASLLPQLLPDAAPDVLQRGLTNAYQFYQTISISLSFTLIFKINFILPFSCKRDTHFGFK